jgi:hypothetical protein
MVQETRRTFLSLSGDPFKVVSGDDSFERVEEPPLARRHAQATAGDGESGVRSAVEHEVPEPPRFL